jgi:hypothetical protein
MQKDMRERLERGAKCARLVERVEHTETQALPHEPCNLPDKGGGLVT